MAFDYVKFLAENKLTSTSKLDEKARLLNENYIDLRPINSLKEIEISDEDLKDLTDDEPEDTGMYDFMSKGKSDEFDIEDEEPVATQLTGMEDVIDAEEERSLQDLESELKGLFKQYGGPGVASKNPEYLEKAKDLSTKIRALRAKQAEDEEEEF